MATFIRLDDSPMFQKQVRSLEQTSDELRDRCQKLYKSCRKYTDMLGEAFNGDMSFAASLEAFGGGLDDLLGVSIGGPVLSKFINALRELATYKEFLRSQVEHVLVDRLSQFLSVDLQDAKESRRRFDKAIYTYDQAREKFASLKKTTRDEIVAELEEDLQNSKSAFERSRFNLVNALTNVEAKKKFEFLESFSAIMDAHLRFYKLGFNLLNQMEPFIHQVLTYAQQSKEQAKIEQDKLAKRIQEFRTQSELNQLQASNNLATNNLATSSNATGVNGYCMDAYKRNDAIILATSKGEVQTIKQGYLLKRSSSLRADWKRRFFVLDSQGTLYYYRNKGVRPGVAPSLHPSHPSENNHRVFARFRSRHHRESSLGEESLGCSTVDLRTSTIKIDAEDTDLRLCFRIISPIKTYTLQAETEADRIDWMNKIRGVIASLLNSHLHQLDMGNVGNDPSGASFNQTFDNAGSTTDDMRVNRADSVSKILREVPGNDQCAECSASEPYWASLNLGVLICIECSGIHRNLGVHISKIRSVTLDVKVWEPTVLELFQILGNTYCNSVWEELLPLHRDLNLECEGPAVTKPGPEDASHQKELYIQAKYVRKLLVNKEASSPSTIWEAVKSNNLREVYRLTISSDVNMVNSTYEDMFGCSLHHDDVDLKESSYDPEIKQSDPTTCERIKSSGDPGSCLQGCSLLHLACHGGSLVMLELLLQLGADVNKFDYHGRTPLQHCILKGNNVMAKYLLRRGARASIKDAGGCTALERAMEMGAITDEELFILLAESD